MKITKADHAEYVELKTYDRIKVGASKPKEYRKGSKRRQPTKWIELVVEDEVEENPLDLVQDHRRSTPVYGLCWSIGQHKVICSYWVEGDVRVALQDVPYGSDYVLSDDLTWEQVLSLASRYAGRSDDGGKEARELGLTVL